MPERVREGIDVALFTDLQVLTPAAGLLLAHPVHARRWEAGSGFGALGVRGGDLSCGVPFRRGTPDPAHASYPLHPVRATPGVGLQHQVTCPGTQHSRLLQRHAEGQQAGALSHKAALPPLLSFGLSVDEHFAQAPTLGCKPEPRSANFVAGAALCEHRSADFVAGTALCEPRSADFVAGAALCEHRSADFVGGAALCALRCSPLALTHAHTHTDTHTHTHTTHTHTRSLSHYDSHLHSHSLSLSLTLTHAHTHSHTHHHRRCHHGLQIHHRHHPSGPQHSACRSHTHTHTLFGVSCRNIFLV